MLELIFQADEVIYKWEQCNESELKKREIEKSFGWDKDSHCLVLIDNGKSSLKVPDFLNALPSRLRSWLEEKSEEYASL